MTKILMITPSFYPAFHYGGPIYSTYELAKALKKTSVDIRVITTNANGNEKLKIKTGTFHKLESDLPVKYFNSFDSRGSSISMNLNLRKEFKHADIIFLISIFSLSTPLTIFLCKRYKKKIILSPQGQLGKWSLAQGSVYKRPWLKLFIEPHIKILSWQLTSVKEETEVLTVYPFAKTFVIPNGVSSELFQLNEKKKDKTFFNKYCGLDCSDKHIIISMGRLHEVKGFDILIEAIGKIEMIEKIGEIGKIEKQNVVLLIAGEDFGERQKLDWMIGNLGLREKVFLIGRIEGLEKIEFLRNADVFALASHHENFGMVYAEALASGTPVVASKNAPWQDVEKHNLGKWIENTPEKFAEAITEILISDPLQMGKNGSKYIMENFSWDKIATNFMFVLNNILKKNI